MNPVGPGAAGSVQQILAMRQALVDRSALLKDLQAAQGADAPKPAAGGFGEALSGALEQVKQAQDKSSTITDAYERGEVTDVTKVMLARQEAGVAFEATLQVRNRLLSAYQDIMRMGV